MAELKVGEICIHRAEQPQLNLGNGKRVPRFEQREVYLMAVSGIWAMVRRPGCMPYVAEVKELRAFKPKPF